MFKSKLIQNMLLFRVFTTMRFKLHKYDNIMITLIFKNKSIELLVVNISQITSLLKS